MKRIKVFIHYFRKGLDAAGMEKIGEALGYIEVIEGYLLIDFSISFISLHMFKRLRVIKGNILYRDRHVVKLFSVNIIKLNMQCFHIFCLDITVI